MYVTSSLAGPPRSKATPQRVAPPEPFFDGMNWQQQQMNDNFGAVYDPYGFSGAMDMSWLSAGPMYCEGGYPQTEMKETGSDASTEADTSPYVADDFLYADKSNFDGHDMVWNNLPFPNFTQAVRQESGWGGLQHLPDVIQPDADNMGSAKHQEGKCKPCAFAWKPEGCGSGVECQFCHLCPPGEKQRRKRAVRNTLRSCPTPQWSQGESSRNSSSRNY